jgi:(p)ppGpp synthase/HD superfamily hydrolase
MMSSIVKHASIFATAAHAAIDQRRKYSDLPYIVHPESVSSIVESFGGTPSQIAAAWLHDVVEDTSVTLELIESLFGEEVANYVDWLTNVATYDDGNRATRRAIDRAHTAQAPKNAQFVKCADLLSNMSDVGQADPEFAKLYMSEIRLLLDVMSIKDTAIWRTASEVNQDYLDKK